MERRNWTADFVGQCNPSLEPRGWALAAEAVNNLNVHPDTGVRPGELMPGTLKVYGDESYFEPMRIVGVTCGGLKFCWPVELSPSGGPTFEHVLRYQVFFAFKRDKRTGEVTELPLPADLSLPRQWVAPVPQPSAGMFR